MGYLIDTSIFIAWERDEIDLAATLTAAGDEPVFLSVVSASELLHGVHRADSARRRSRRQKFVESVLAAIPAIAVSLAVARVHAAVWADLASEGALIGAHDLWIASTALAHDHTIATRNAREFSRVDALRIEVW